MRVYRASFLIGVVMFVALFYVHQQVEIVKLSYSIRSKEQGVAGLRHERERLVYRLDHLTSSPSLERILVAKKINVRYPDKECVIRAADGMQRDRTGEITLARRSIRGAMKGILELLGMGPEAYARER